MCPCRLELLDAHYAWSRYRNSSKRKICNSNSAELETEMYVKKRKISNSANAQTKFLEKQIKDLKEKLRVEDSRIRELEETAI